MAPTLSHERATFVEHLQPPRGVRLLLFATGVVAAAVGLVLAAAFRSRMGWPHMAWMLAGPTVGVVAVVVCGAARGRTAVFADRLEVPLHVGGLAVWRRRVPWAAVERCDVRRRQPGHLGYQVWCRGPGLTAVMFGGDGVGLRVRGGGELAIGSADPGALLTAIRVARTTEPPPPPPG